MRKYPILHSGGEYIPFDFILEHEAQALRNHSQTVQRLSERGGTDWIETLCIIKDESSSFIFRMSNDEIEKAIPRARQFVLYKAYEWLMKHDKLGD